MIKWEKNSIMEIDLRHMRLERSDPMYQIMLVEDEILVRESMVQNTNWRALGFDTPIACGDGREAMQALETVRPDVVITDICMPFVDGLELAAHIRAQKGDDAGAQAPVSMAQLREREFDRIASIVHASVDMDAIYRILRGEV